MTTYELTVTSTGEDFFNARKQLINDFIQQITGAEVVNTMLGNGKIVSCLNPCNNFESVICTVYFDLDETKSYGIVTAINCGGLRFVDESLKALYDEFVEANYNIKHQEFLAAQEAQRREREEQKKAERKRKEQEKKQQEKNQTESDELDELNDEE